jgi:hypothetical protein
MQRANGIDHDRDVRSLAPSLGEGREREIRTIRVKWESIGRRYGVCLRARA